MTSYISLRIEPYQNIVLQISLSFSLEAPHAFRLAELKTVAYVFTWANVGTGFAR